MRGLTLVLLFAGCAAPDSAGDPVGVGGDTDVEVQPDPTTAPEPHVCGAEGLTVEAGTGYTAYEPLADGDFVALYSGEQAAGLGRHVYGGGSVSGTVSEAVSVVTSLYWPRMEMDVTGNVQPVFLALAGWEPEACEGDFYGVEVRLAFDPTFDPGMPWADFYCGLDGEEFEMTIVVGDLVTGAETTTVRTVIGRSDPDSTYCD